MTSFPMRVSLSDLTIVVFSRDRAAGLERLIRYMQVRAERFRLLIFDNGQTPAILDPSVLPDGVSYQYDRGGFVRQHERAANDLSTPFAMLADDDSLIGIEGVLRCISCLKNHPDLVAAHGSIAEWDSGGLANQGLTAKYLSLDSSTWASEKMARIEQNFIKREYWSRYWYAVHPSQNLSSYLSLIGSIRESFGHGDLPELAFESACLVKGQTCDVKRITLWKSPENPTLVSSTHPTEFWNSPEFDRVSRNFVNRLAEEFALDPPQASQFHHAMRKYSSQYRVPSGVLEKTVAFFMGAYNHRFHQPRIIRRLKRQPHRSDIENFFEALARSAGA